MVCPLVFGFFSSGFFSFWDLATMGSMGAILFLDFQACIDDEVGDIAIIIEISEVMLEVQ